MYELSSEKALFKRSLFNGNKYEVLVDEEYEGTK